MMPPSPLFQDSLILLVEGTGNTMYGTGLALVALILIVYTYFGVRSDLRPLVYLTTILTFVFIYVVALGVFSVNFGRPPLGELTPTFYGVRQNR